MVYDDAEKPHSAESRKQQLDKLNTKPQALGAHLAASVFHNPKRLN
jgi:hypothetical protein